MIVSFCMIILLALRTDFFFWYLSFWKPTTSRHLSGQVVTFTFTALWNQNLTLWDQIGLLSRQKMHWRHFIPAACWLKGRINSKMPFKPDSSTFSLFKVCQLVSLPAFSQPCSAPTSCQRGSRASCCPQESETPGAFCKGVWRQSRTGTTWGRGGTTVALRFGDKLSSLVGQNWDDNPSWPRHDSLSMHLMLADVQRVRTAVVRGFM